MFLLGSFLHVLNFLFMFLLGSFLHVFDVLYMFLLTKNSSLNKRFPKIKMFLLCSFFYMFLMFYICSTLARFRCAGSGAGPGLRHRQQSFHGKQCHLHPHHAPARPQNLGGFRRVYRERRQFGYLPDLQEEAGNGGVRYV